MKLDKEETKRVGIPVMRTEKKSDVKSEKVEKKQKKAEEKSVESDSISFRDEE